MGFFWSKSVWSLKTFFKVDLIYPLLNFLRSKFKHDRQNRVIHGSFSFKKGDTRSLFSETTDFDAIKEKNQPTLPFYFSLIFYYLVGLVTSE